MIAKRLQFIAQGMVRRKPITWCGSIKWPWILTPDQRTAVDNATRGERIDDEHYGRVLDARVSGHAVKTGKKRDNYDTH